MRRCTGLSPSRTSGRAREGINDRAEFRSRPWAPSCSHTDVEPSPEPPDGGPGGPAGGVTEPPPLSAVSARSSSEGSGLRLAKKRFLGMQYEEHYVHERSTEGRPKE